MRDLLLYPYPQQQLEYHYVLDEFIGSRQKPSAYVLRSCNGYPDASPDMEGSRTKEPSPSWLPLTGLDAHVPRDESNDNISLATKNTDGS